MSQTATAPAPSTVRTLLPGILLATALAVVAWLLGRAVPIVGGPVFGVVLGAVVAATAKPLARRPELVVGVKFVGSRVLQSAVVLLGLQVSIPQVLAVGWRSLPVMLGTLAACLLGAWAIGRALGVDRDLRTLIGVGTAICGASAIAAITPVLRPASAKVAYALSVVFLFNVAAVIAFPWLGHALGMSQEAFGLFAGTAVNDTSSVVAAASVYGREATDTAVVVKLTRTLLIIPITLFLAWATARREAAGEVPEGGAAPAATGWRRVTRLVPWFLIGFVLLAGINSITPVPQAWHEPLVLAATFLITAALTAIGLTTDLAGFRRAGAAPLLLGAALWLIVSGTSLGLQALTTGLR